MTRLRTAFAIVVLLTSIPSYSASAVQGDSLDGKAFAGKIRGTGLLRLIGSETTIEFKDGTLTWTEGADYKPAPYETTKENGSIIFKARAAGREGGAYVDDYVEWRGVYDGESLRDVTAVWTRKQGGGDWLHDLLLPEVVTFVFEEK